MHFTNVGNLYKLNPKLYSQSKKLSYNINVINSGFNQNYICILHYAILYKFTIQIHINNGKKYFTQEAQFNYFLPKKKFEFLFCAIHILIRNESFIHLSKPRMNLLINISLFQKNI